MAINSAFDGARLFLSQPAGQHMNLQHQFHLGREKSYHFAPTYVGTLNKLSPQEVRSRTSQRAPCHHMIGGLLSVPTRCKVKRVAAGE